MKLKFEASLPYQQEAIAAVCDVFRGQSRKKPLFSVTEETDSLPFARDDEVLPQEGNHLEISEEQVLKNIRDIQLRNGLPQSKSLSGLNLDIEMETGTGKTYVYLRTILELHQRYGFTKFVIAVPSVPIKEGVKKTIDITREHFAALYQNVPYDAYLYDSKQMGHIRDFASRSTLQIMVIIIDAFQKDTNLINRYSDKKFGGAKPIEFLQATHPIVIIDEPQSTISTDDQWRAVKTLHPLATIRYSATPVRVENKIYKLDAVDSYEQRLVKRIEVDSCAVEDAHNDAYIRLKSVSNRGSRLSAKVEMDVLGKKGTVKRVMKTVHVGDDFEELTGRPVYAGYIVDDIFCKPGNEWMSFSPRNCMLRLGEAVGSFADEEIKRQQIRATIRAHLEKEQIFLEEKRNIKVLSLFFLNHVADYRTYDENGEPQEGEYARWFEEIYTEEIRKPRYQDLCKRWHPNGIEAALVHDGYFSQDSKKKAQNKESQWKDTKEGASSAADASAYHLIMQNKERLLSFDCPVRFIFSHSALREGWDNPNVFQICTMRETKSDMWRRQAIGRGLRLCVDQDGNRVRDEGVNNLTVIANESFEEFAAGLQEEYEKDGIRFGVLEACRFAKLHELPTENADAEDAPFLGTEKGEAIMAALRAADYIDETGHVTSVLRDALRSHDLQLPEEFCPYMHEIATICHRACGNLGVRRRGPRVPVHINEEIFGSPEFKFLWDKIKWRTSYRVKFSKAVLLERCRKKIADRDKLYIPKPRIVVKKAALHVAHSGIDTEELHDSKTAYAEKEKERCLPDIVAYIQNATNLTRRTIVELLTGTHENPETGIWEPFDDYGSRLEDFKKNPQAFMEGVTEIIRKEMQHLIVDGICYHRLDGQYYQQELFRMHELGGYADSNLLPSKHSVYDHVIYDSTNEERFARVFEANASAKDGAIRLYAKLPDWFTIGTPLGTYNPDWALVIREEGEERLYFVLESKANSDEYEKRGRENDKIHCGRRHFEALGEGAIYREVDDPDEFLEYLDESDQI